MVLFKLAGAFGVLYSVLVHPFTDLGDYHGVDSLVLIFFEDGYQQGVDSVVFPQSLEDVNETEGEHVALRFLESQRKGGKCDAESHHLVILVHDHRDIVQAQVREELVLQVLALGRG